jgi:hypothetical protein
MCDSCRALLQVGPLDSFFIEGPAPKEHAISDLGNGGSSGRGAGEEEEGESDDVCVDDLLAAIEVCWGVHMYIEVCGVKSCVLGAPVHLRALSLSMSLFLSMFLSFSPSLSPSLSDLVLASTPSPSSTLTHETNSLFISRSILSLRTPLC